VDALGITWKNFLITAGISIAVALFARSFVLETYRIPTKSMAPSLTPGDIIVVNKAYYGFHRPLQKGYLFRWNEVQRGDIILFPLPDDDSRIFVKRVFGLPHDRIQISKNGNASLLNNKGPNAKSNASNPENRVITLEENELFVLGDNASEGTDSRHWGPVDERTVIGKIWKVISKGSIEDPKSPANFK
jgi:signal peptidase I